MNANPNPNVIPNPSQNASLNANQSMSIASAGQTNAAPAPGNMRPETYQRTLEYVQQCQTWTTGDSVKAAKESKAAQGAAECVKVVSSVPGPASAGQDAVSSSTDRQDQANVSAMIMSASNMVVHDMNTSLNSLMQENRFLQMIQ